MNDYNKEINKNINQNNEMGKIVAKPHSKELIEDEVEDKTRELSYEMSKNINFSSDNSLTQAYNKIIQEKQLIEKELNDNNVNYYNKHLSKVTQEANKISNKNNIKLTAKDNNKYSADTYSSKQSPNININQNNQRSRSNLKHKNDRSISPINNKDNNKVKETNKSRSKTPIKKFSNNHSSINNKNINAKNFENNKKQQLDNNLNNDNLINSSFQKLQEEFLKSQNEIKLHYDYSLLIDEKYNEMLPKSEKDDLEYNNSQINYSSSNHLNLNNNYKFGNYNQKEFDYNTKREKKTAKNNTNNTNSTLKLSGEEINIAGLIEEFADYKDVHHGDVYLSEHQKLHNLKEAEAKNDIFNRLYIDAFKKKDNTQYNDEIKYIKEIKECTFKPKINKRFN